MPSVFVMRALDVCVYSVPFTDTFTRADGAVGNCWVGDGTITSGVASGTQLKRDATTPNVDVTFDYDRNGSVTHNFLWRLQATDQAASDYYYFAFGTATTYFSFHAGGGGDTPVASASYVAPASGTARVIASATQAALYINGDLILISAYTPTAGADGTWVSFQSGDSTPCKTDNVTLSAVTYEPLSTYSDDFNRADGALGSAWTTTNNNGWVISSNRARPNTSVVADQQSTRTDAPSMRNMQVSAVVAALPTSNAGGVTGRWVDANNYYYCDVIPGGTVRLFKCVGGVHSNLLGGGAGTVAVGGTIALRCVGSTISAWINGVQVASATDTSLTQGRGGLRGDDPNVRLDDHTVTLF